MEAAKAYLPAKGLLIAYYLLEGSKKAKSSQEQKKPRERQLPKLEGVRMKDEEEEVAQPLAELQELIMVEDERTQEGAELSRAESPPSNLQLKDASFLPEGLKVPVKA
ncbi:hypothetical protein C0995_014464 [Termitomyces sp. Mi166|nr:hypothetical protein C0995_014464 [Termitomyces sp. Mi166\